jgi:hypothetical protein
MFGMPSVPVGMYGVASGESALRNNDQGQMEALAKALAAVRSQNQTPNGRVARGFNQFGPQPTGPVAPMLATPDMPPPVQITPDNDTAPKPSQAPGALSQAWAGPHSVGGAPLPNMGPTSVGGAPLATASPMDNAQWPAGPVGAPMNAQASMPAPAADLGPQQQASGPDVIQKLMSYFKNKDNPSS